MNSCEYYQELISTFVDGELSREESEALMLHLNSCSRCNAMYAVFQDLSDILSEDAEPLPEGLHENIMAGVRRSELVRKNRRLRKIGLRTAMTAAACAVLVLFAAMGFDPGRRADSVSIRSAEEARELMQTPLPAVESPVAENPAAEYAASVVPSAPAWTQAPAPEQARAVTGPDAYYTADSNTVTYTPVQPEQYPFSFEEEYTEPTWTPVPEQYAAPAQTAEPAQYSAPAQTAEPAQYSAPAQTAEPAQYSAPAQTAEPVQTAVPAETAEPVQTAVPAQAAEPVQTAVPAETAEPVQIQQTIPEVQFTEKAAFGEVPPVASPDVSVSLKQAPAAAQSTDSEEISLQSAAEETEDTQMNETAASGTAADTETEAEPDTDTEEAPTIFSFFSGMINRFDAAPTEQLAESKLAAPAVIEAALDELDSDNGGEESPAPVLNGIPLENGEKEEIAPGIPSEDSAAQSVSEERVSVYGSELRSRLLAMIGSSVDSLPQEAELTRLVHVSLVPEDEYGSEEEMVISIYGDFVYCSLYPLEGGSVTYRADCSLRELDSFLDMCKQAPAPSAAPTPDPYIAGTPIPDPDVTAEEAGDEAPEVSAEENPEETSENTEQDSAEK